MSDFRRDRWCRQILFEKLLTTRPCVSIFFLMVASSESNLTAGQVDFGVPYGVTVVDPSPRVIVVCEHASPHIPRGLSRLGLSKISAQSHIAWDPGAFAVAQAVAQLLPSVLIHGTVSRLVYDCNRPPEADSAIPVRSEVFDIPGNQNLTPEDRNQRINKVYQPFSRALADQIASNLATLQLMVTIHSFTPVFHGVSREVEIGILHGSDERFAEAMMREISDERDLCIRLNEPYAADDGVAHTLDMHGAENGLPNVMIEIRNDLIKTPEDQSQIASYLTDWITTTLRRTSLTEGSA